MDRAAVQAEVHSPLWQAGLYRPPGRDALLDPAALCRGLARVARARGIRIHEHTRVTRADPRGGWGPGRHGRRGRASGRPTSWSPRPPIRAGCAGSARMFVPVYDYVIVSEPLTPDERRSIGWQRRQGLSDANNQFHYFRLTADDRILWGGYDAIHYFGSRVAPELDDRPATFRRLEAQFVRAFPQLGTLRFPYRWGGAIDTTTRFTVTFGQALGGRVTYALGYTGLGVGASRWAGGVVRDLILRPDEDRLRLRIVQSPPVPFPPEPLRSIAVNVVRHELDRADRNEGRRSLLLRTLDWLGIGFDL